MLKRCSFCGKPENKVLNMFSAGSSNICDDCVVYCYEMLAGHDLINADNDSNSKNSARQLKLKKPEEIKKVLDEYVIGQEEAKTALSVAVYNHYKRIEQAEKANDVELQ
ncbi:MAG: ATP-dependent Clp protease ATP-binding subunit ClpX, partial [Oscillospiraceae bacterium]|nr:ATP-dependent Clp protease ATP-binding subunit ClpX [Oscillospiraceae bacterium]